MKDFGCECSDETLMKGGNQTVQWENAHSKKGQRKGQENGKERITQMHLK